MRFERLSADLDSLDKEEKEILSWLRSNIDDINIDNLEEDLLMSIKRDIKIHNQIRETIAEVQFTDKDLEEIKHYASLKKLFKSQRKQEEHSLEDLEKLLKELEKTDLEDSRNPPELNLMKKKAESLSRKLSEDYWKIYKEEKTAVSGLRNQCLEILRQDISAEIEKLKERPTVFFEEEPLKKFLQRVKEYKYGETGGFLKISEEEDRLYVTRFFHEENQLKEIDWDAVDSRQELFKLIENKLPWAENIKSMAERGENPIERLEKMSNRMYVPSKDLVRMYEEFGKKEEIITWHTHPLPSSSDEYWPFLSSYKASGGDININNESIGSGYNGYYYEAIGKPYLPETESNGYEPRNSLVMPQRWEKGTKRTKNVEFLPIWLSKNGKPLDTEYVRNNFPLIPKYNKAICRAESIGKGKFLGLFIQDNYERLTPEIENKIVDKKEYRLLGAVQELLSEIEVSETEYV